VITEDGERIAHLGRRMESESFAVQRTALAGQESYTGEVIVSAPPALACTLIAPRVNELRMKHPQLSLQLIGSLGSASLSRREADIAVRLSRPTEPDLVARKVATLPFHLYGSADYLANIAYDETMEQTPQQDWLQAQAGDRPILLRSNDLNIQATCAQAGAGVAALPYFLGRHYGLQAMEPEGEDFARDVWLVVHSDIRHTPAVQAVMSFLASCFNN
jgi:DNA-binding transcriptional LysR family regulator